MILTIGIKEDLEPFEIIGLPEELIVLHSILSEIDVGTSVILRVRRFDSSQQNGGEGNEIFKCFGQLVLSNSSPRKFEGLLKYFS